MCRAHIKVVTRRGDRGRGHGGCCLLACLWRRCGRELGSRD
ncbi:hypothetical protein CABS03_04813 [Colletotrichum abscissum]|uniref:Uncharacterized protein n=1 Tax=Colletotrichum abscissum TaxID=1671311 RepID=A0A9P9X1C4_9PEZI|nr:hypothetical protein CABS02_14485 [Colletotrichum abscissum]